MIFSIKTITSVAALFSLAAAGPVLESNLAARSAGEELYLVNCNGSSIQSQMNYYKNGANSHNLQQPDSVAVVSNGNYVIWEGHEIVGSFAQSNGGIVTATSQIFANGSSIAYGKFAGTAYNSYGQNFDCYKDNDHLLHYGVNGPGFACYSIYNCFDSQA